MKQIKAVFGKQVKDMLKNPMVLVQFIIFPAVALIMTGLIAKTNDDIPNNMFVTMMAAIFAGIALVTSMTVVIAEDIERKSLRLLVMAGVKSHEYLIGTGGCILLGGVIVSLIFGMIGDFTGSELVKFLVVMVGSTMASLLVGAILGMLSKNQQAAAAIGTPVAMLLGFTPMIASFNTTVEKAAGLLYTQQLNVIVNDFSANFGKAVLVIAGNILVFTVIFIAVYKKKGLRE